MSFLDALISLIAPYSCLGCQHEGALLCNDCSNGLRPLKVTKYPLITVQAGCAYTGLAKDLLWKLKSDGTQAAANSMACIISQRCQLPSLGILVPIPTASSRVRARGYDQAVLLARSLSRQTGLPYRQLLVRQNQAHQVGSNRAQRQQQLVNAFRIKHRMTIVGQTIILVDDVSTTGATLEVAAQLLLAAGASHVEAVTFAQA